MMIVPSNMILSLTVVAARATEVPTLHDWHQIQPDDGSLLLPPSIPTNLRSRCIHVKCDTMATGNRPSPAPALSIDSLDMRHGRIERRRKLSWAGSLYNMRKYEKRFRRRKGYACMHYTCSCAIVSIDAFVFSFILVTSI